MKFKIGHYFDEVLCDIMPMDCCHILLGRPWQYDRYDVHNGRLNQYTLWVNGKKQTFLPLIEVPNEVNCTAVKIGMVNGKKFEKEMKKSQVYFSIVPRGLSVGSNGRVVEASNDQVTADSDSRVPVEIIEFLNEYKDIIADDIPDGLPLVRSIIHCIDLIPRAMVFLELVLQTKHHID